MIGVALGDNPMAAEEEDVKLPLPRRRIDRGAEIPETLPGVPAAKAANACEYSVKL
jgi:hypothetical protein